MANKQPINWSLGAGEVSFDLYNAILAFWEENPVFYEILCHSRTMEETRERAYHYLAEFERKSLQGITLKNPLERATARRALFVLKNIFAKRNEELTGCSALNLLSQLAHGQKPMVTLAFVEEFRHLFLAMKGKTGIYQDLAPEISRHEGLSVLARQAHNRIRRYPNGLQVQVKKKREENRLRIMEYFGIGPEQWGDWKWQVRHVIRDEKTLANLVLLTDGEKEAIAAAKQHGIPFGITPYYASLMDFQPHRRYDHAIRAQVIPPEDYIEGILKGRQDPSQIFDFMGERDTSPEVLITRRYPMIAILKPYNTCAQICVYCQRNWEIDDILSPNAQAPEEKLQKALAWFQEHPEVEEILITGGDPGIMDDHILEQILNLVSELLHVKRIRIGTRVPVVLPMRITESYAELLSRYHLPGQREVAVMTHFQHPYEVTPEAMEAVQRLRKQGIPVYNQGVFTLENARRFEMASLRRLLRLIGVDPYYTFNTKGKEETRSYRVPISRLLQEQAEEARLHPGLDRTDEAVFNIPRLGKNYLRAGQDHEVIMITPQGERIYEFYSWRMQSSDHQPYIYKDVPILAFLEEMERRGEKIENYRSVWYYY